MALDPETVKRLEMERKSIARQIAEFEDQILKLEEDAEAIDTLLGLGKSTQPTAKKLKAFIGDAGTFREGVIATVRYLNRPARPVEVAEKMAETGIFDPEGLNGKVATELYKLSRAGKLFSEDGLYAADPKKL